MWQKDLVADGMTVADSVASVISEQTGQNPTPSEWMLCLIIEHLVRPKHDSSSSLSRRELNDILNRVVSGGHGDTPTKPR